MLPILPQQDPRPGARRAAVSRARATYKISHAYKAEARPGGIAVATRVPPLDEYSPGIIAKITAVDLRLLSNHYALGAVKFGGSPLLQIQGITTPRTTLGDLFGLTRQVGLKHTMFNTTYKSSGSIARSFPATMQQYKEVFVTIPKPPTIEKYDDVTQRDKLFSWQRIAGANPMVLQGILVVPDYSSSPTNKAARTKAAEGIWSQLKENIEGAAERMFEDVAGDAIEWIEKSIFGKELGELAEGIEELGAVVKALTPKSPVDRGPQPPAGLATPKNDPIIRGVLPPRFPVTNELFQRVMRDTYGIEDDIYLAARERRLYVADWRLLDRIPNGHISDGVLNQQWPKTITAPMAMFVWKKQTDDEEGELVPVAIQCYQHPPKKWKHDESTDEWVATVEPNPIFTPDAGVKWQMACSTVNCADATHHEMVWHLGRSHMLMEAVYLCARRTLAENHPLMILIAQHCEFTLAINDYATKHLIAPGGQVDELFGATLDGTLTVMARALSEFRLDRADPVTNIQERHIESTAGLPEFPWRDDALLLWPILHRWVERYVELYYGDDDDVRLDHELQDFLALLANPKEGGGIGGVPTVPDGQGGQQPGIESRELLTKIVATLVWTGSAQHSCLNYTQFPFFGYVPSSPLSLFAEPPTLSTPENELNWEQMLAPSRDAVMQADIAYQLSGVRWRKLGHYKPDAFSDPRLKPYLDHFLLELDEAEARMKERDQHRFLSYSYLFPSQVQNSIFI